MSRTRAVVNEVAIELSTWPGVSLERRSDGAEVVRYAESELGVLHPELGVAEIPFLEAEHDELVERGDAEPNVSSPDSTGVSHALYGPSDVTAVLELFDRRYRDLRGDDAPFSSSDE